MIVCQNVTKRFGQKEVLKGIDFSIKKGQIFGLLGPSGAGKTTLIKILTDQLGFDGGSIRVLGKEVGSLTGEDKKKIGIMMDQFGVYERLSCADNLKLFADIYGIDHKKVKEILDQVGLSEAYNRPAMNLSKGMRARLQLARVFMHSPKIIFLDEPTSGLDPQSMRAIHQIILKKKEEGCTIFLTTHNMKEATYESELKLYEIEQELMEQDFIRVSKQSIINLKKVKSLKADINRKICVTLQNEEQIIVSRMYSDELRKRLGVK